MNIIEKDINFYTEKMNEAKENLIKSFPSIKEAKEIHETYCTIVLKLNYLKHLLIKKSHVRKEGQMALD